VIDLIEQLSRDGGRTVFLCTHNLTEAQRLCDRVAVMNHGRLLALGTVPELARSLWQGIWVDIDFQRVEVEVKGVDAVPGVVAQLVEQGQEIIRVDPRTPTLEDIYFALQEGQE
jgi:ABC-2 type transport system ATP-binding protein